MKPVTKKGQAFITDYIIGLLMFFALAVMAVTLIAQIVPNEAYQQLYADNVYLSQTLVDTGYPANWTNETVIFLGIAENFRLNVTKLKQFDNISYEETQGLFQVATDYLFFFENKSTLLNISQCVHGYNITVSGTTCEPQLNTINYTDLVRTTRLLAHNGSMIRMVVYSWS